MPKATKTKQKIEFKTYAESKPQSQNSGRLTEFGQGKTDFTRTYTPQELGEGQFISRLDYVQKVEVQKGRERAGKLQEQSLKANAAWIKVDNQKEKNVNLTTQGQIIRATGAMLQNEAAYRASVVPLHLQLRTNQLGTLANAVSTTGYAVDVSSAQLLAEGVGGGIDFSNADQHSEKEVQFVEAEIE